MEIAGALPRFKNQGRGFQDLDACGIGIKVPALLDRQADDRLDLASGSRPLRVSHPGRRGDNLGTRSDSRGPVSAQPGTGRLGLGVQQFLDRNQHERHRGRILEQRRLERLDCLPAPRRGTAARPVVR